MKISRLATTSALALALAASCGSALAQHYVAPGPGYGYGQGPDWRTPPGEYNEFRQAGFRDGIEGARKDFENHRPFTPENRDEFRHPHVPRNVYRDYREAFREGYHRAVQNLGYGHPR